MILGGQHETVAQVNAESAENDASVWDRVREVHRDRARFFSRVVTADECASQARHYEAVGELSGVLRPRKGQFRLLPECSLLPR